ncbi:MAG: ABC transporter substrate-binding protein [Pigeon pea little leaf phytoplasma]|uniref:ABC transporter substrate-binding protein n=1 Tax=Candidatus Phytoplasma fabacearum TaxID=2982628 RepID=A0ABU8ZT63_9MOLU|nr:ABC transporter substrate-binding protein ['Bituminaria bituminosa' little leaf phytoplasma]MDV3158744.1 ABC transporter substrate-binding protein [Pigeon pea little leaf phytoplasma]MDO8024023.1 ABC transporter substrate-binding protein ['Bituminaria bituminosa' little leaf phytoplasma]MDV3161601.1 ABC transporter substrate-binding protein [Pigeon pea little leaf phytoplasma]MDV3195750.1 ABC transporter substrate-binding protein [Pigeon pea little leaf phytoplasma]MDV3200354.1 ABC transpor
MIFILISILLGSLGIFLLVNFRILQNKKIIALIISVFIIIILWVIIKYYQKSRNNLNEQNKHILTAGLTVPVQEGFGIFGQGANTVVNSRIRDLLHEYLIKAYPFKENNIIKTIYKPCLLTAMPEKITEGEFAGYYQCCLSPGIKFHNGRILNNQDVIDNFFYNKETGGEHSSVIQDIKPDNNDINRFFILFTDDQDPLNYHHLSKIPIIIFEGDKNKIPNRRIGLGAFQLKYFDNNNIQLDRFIDYYRKDDYSDSNIEQIKFCYIPDTQTINMHLKKGDIDISYLILDKTSSKDLSRSSDLQIMTPESLTITYLFLNCQKLSIEERKSIVETLTPGKKQQFLEQLGEDSDRYQIVNSMSDPRMIGYLETPNFDNSCVSRRPDTNKSISFLSINSTSPISYRYASRITDFLQKEGFNVKHEIRELNELANQGEKGDFDMLMISENFEDINPYYVLNYFFGPKDKGGSMCWHQLSDDEEILQGLNNLKLNSDNNDYDQQVRNLHQLLFNKYAIIPLYCQKYSEMAIRKNIKNFNINILGNQDITKLRKI